MQWLFESITWSALVQIVAIDILLGGDNAVIIALACRNLPLQLRNKAILAGVAGAILLRIVLLFFAIQLLSLPGLKIIGAALLLWIGIKLLKPEDDNHNAINGGVSFVAAIKTIIIADAVMSLDNVLALAGAAGGDLMLVFLGVLISIPIIVWGSQLVLALMDKFPQVIILGAGLLGWISGGMLVSDIWLQPRIPFPADVTHYIASAVGGLLVVAVGILLKRQKSASSDTRTTQQ
ncbi:TerC family protein [Pseudomonas shirazica]|uniref:TerC family protein n=1 Tax=Pseudomonas shirazica TaxID=1940636 RepID=UPI001119E9D1|nr:TerC family protein [Pseudomonas shirazica]